MIDMLEGFKQETLHRELYSDTLLFYFIKYTILEGKQKFNHHLRANIYKARSSSRVIAEIVLKAFSLRHLDNLPSGCKDVSAFQACQVIFVLKGEVSRQMKGGWELWE